jgi:hypothetical protein
MNLLLGHLLSIPRSTLLLPMLILVAAAASLAQAAPKTPAKSNVSMADVSTLLQGKFDNREQVQKAAAAKAGAAPEDHPALPHVIVQIEVTPKPEWSLWHVHLDADPDISIDTTWAVQTHTEGDGSLSLIPHYLLKPPAAPPAAQGFDPQAWLSLEGCALRGEFGKARIQAAADGMPCMVVATGIGSQRALLPVAIERQGESLHLDFIYRGADTQIDARKSP